MPKRAYRVCTYPGCNELVQDGPRCARHPADKQRPNANARGYDYEWLKKRRAFLQKHPWCSNRFGLHDGEQRKAMHVDHVIPLKEGGADDESNYDGKCTQCHNYKTAKFDGGFGNTKSSEGRGGQNV